jgi:hypothetical protein
VLPQLLPQRIAWIWAEHNGRQWITALTTISKEKVFWTASDNSKRMFGGLPLRHIKTYLFEIKEFILLHYVLPNITANIMIGAALVYCQS